MAFKATVLLALLAVLCLSLTSCLAKESAHRKMLGDDYDFTGSIAKAKASAAAFAGAFGGYKGHGGDDDDDYHKRHGYKHNEGRYKHDQHDDGHRRRRAPSYTECEAAASASASSSSYGDDYGSGAFSAAKASAKASGYSTGSDGWRKRFASECYAKASAFAVSGSFGK